MDCLWIVVYKSKAFIEFVQSEVDEHFQRCLSLVLGGWMGLGEE